MNYNKIFIIILIAVSLYSIVTTIINVIIKRLFKTNPITSEDILNDKSIKKLIKTMEELKTTLDRAKILEDQINRIKLIAKKKNITNP